jgi:hypothetical protein
MKRMTSLADRSLQPVLTATAGLPPRIRRDRLRAAAVDQRVPLKILLRRIDWLLIRRTA